MTRLLSCLFVITALAACSSDCCPKHRQHSASHHEKSEGFCENCPKHAAPKVEKHKPCHGGMQGKKDYDVKHDAEWHNRNAN